jgi:hypothetical protein
MRRTATSTAGIANDPHYLRTTISTQDETAARQMSQALKSERAIGRKHSHIFKGIIQILQFDHWPIPLD